MRRDRSDGFVITIIVAILVGIVVAIMVFAMTGPEPKSQPKPNPTSTFESLSSLYPEVLINTTTTSTTEAPMTTQAPTTTTIRASRGVARSQPTEEMDDDFWRKLANCESADGRSGAFVGYFQFSYDTARKVGIDGSESYETQRDAAKTWAAAIHPNEGTNSGWPHCWWIALAA